MGEAETIARIAIVSRLRVQLSGPLCLARILGQSSPFRADPQGKQRKEKQWLFLRSHTDDGGDVSCEENLLSSVVGSGGNSGPQIL